MTALMLRGVPPVMSGVKEEDDEGKSVIFPYVLSPKPVQIHILMGQCVTINEI